MWQHRSSPRQGGKVQSRGTRGSAGAHLSKEARSGAAGHMVAPEPTSVGRCGLKLQLTWQRVDVHLAPCLDIELICGGTRSSGYRQRPPGPPQERLRTRGWGQHFGAPLGYLELFTWQFEAIAIFQQRKDSNYLPKLKIRERPPSTLRNVDCRPLGGAGVGGPGAPTINDKKTSTADPQEMPELEVQKRPPSTLRNIDGGPPGGTRAEDPGAPTINAKKHRRRAPGSSRSWRSRSAHHQRQETSTAGPREVQERPPSTPRNVDDRPLRGAGAGGPGAPAINAKKRRWLGPGRCQS
jgi:hypothetical protein